MPRGYSRFHPVQWSNGGIIVLPNFYSNKFNQFDASLRNSTACLLRYFQKRIFYKNIDLLKNKMTVIQSSIQNGSSVLFLYWFWSSVFFQLDINATWWNICYSSQWATLRIQTKLAPFCISNIILIPSQRFSRLPKGYFIYH